MTNKTLFIDVLLLFRDWRVKVDEVIRSEFFAGSTTERIGSVNAGK
jgi:hypothetical protein